MQNEFIKVHLSERKEAEHFGNILFFAIQSIGYTCFWLRAPGQPLWLGIALAMALSFVESVLFYRRLSAGNRLYFCASKEGVDLPPEGFREPVHFQWNDFSEVETKQILNFTFLRFHLKEEKRQRMGLKLLPSHFFDLPVDQTGFTAPILRRELAHIPEAQHLFPEAEFVAPLAKAA